MSTALQLFFNIVIPTTLFGLVAAGFSIFYSVSRIQHMAIGASVSAAGYIFFYFLKHTGNIVLAIAAAVAVSLLIGFLSNALVYERLQKRRWFSSLVALLSSVMLLLLFQSIILIIFGSQPKSVPLLAAQERYEILGASITKAELFAIPTGLILIAAFAAYLKYSRLGVAIRATADNPEVAEIIGVSTRKIRYITILLASLIAGIAGILIALEFNLEPYASNLHAIRAYGRTIIGGTGSIIGVLVSGLIIDTTEHLGGFFMTSTYKELYSFAIVFIFLLIRPAGIFGSHKR